MSDSVPDFRRVETALHHQEPDRVPLAEVAVHFSIMSRCLRRSVTDDDLAAQVDFWATAGYDYIPLTAGVMRPGGVTKDSQISKVIEEYLKGTDEEDSADAWNIWAKPRIHTEEDFERFPWDALQRLDLSKFHSVLPHLPEGMRIVATSGKIFTSAWMLMGFENFATSLLLNPGFTRAVIERVARIQLAAVERIASIPKVAAVWAVDDIAFGTGPIISPRALRQYIFPWYEEFGRLCRRHRLYFFFHSDGVLWDVMEDLIALGIDALHPIDPTCMDIDEVKRRVGERVCLIGNISNELLEVGSPDEVAELVRQRLRTIAPGGGYLLGAGNSVPEWTPIENYRAMTHTCLEYGRYPIGV